jgi:hypothetical protein
LWSQAIGPGVEVERHCGMIRPVRLTDGERASDQRLGLREAVGDAQQFGEIVEAGSDVGMMWPIARLTDDKCASNQRFGFRVVCLRFEQQAEFVVEVCRGPNPRSWELRCPGC